MIEAAPHVMHCTVAGVTVMLSLTVFMNIVSELMPITSDAVPLIGNTVQYSTVQYTSHFSIMCDMVQFSIA